MSVKFILGRGGSGKSTYMLDKIQERVQDNETSPVILLLPEQYTFEMEKRMSKLFRGEKKDKYLRARVLSFKTMGNIVFSNVASLKSAPSKFAPSKIAFLNLAFLNLLFFKLVPINSVPSKLPFIKLQVLKCAPLKVAKLKFEFEKLQL